jgi:4-aminobutyrate aminotransferase / (S)-3-amino-2-methylpropionate transaminase / 5-aminovalerate transaminase
LNSNDFSIEPQKVDIIQTKHRKIVTDIPPIETCKIFNKLKKFEPNSMLQELPVLWNRAYGYQIFDSSGNCWIDFSSGIFVTNVGHGHPKVVNALQTSLNKPLLHNYYFPSEIRSKLVEKIVKLSPSFLDTVFLLTTGAEATECALKITRINGKKINDKKIVIISFDGSMHGKTLGALMMGGKQKEKHWIGFEDPNIYHIPFPFNDTCPWKESSQHECNETCFRKSMNELKKTLDFSTVAGFMIESYQGWGAMFYPLSYISELKKWCNENNVLIICDEIQSGFGRTGKLFAFEHYELKPDIVCCGKGISSSLPLSAVLSRRELLDGDPSLNSTHGGNPLCCAATLASLDVIEEEDLVNESERKGKIMFKELEKIYQKYPKTIKTISGKGLVAAIHVGNSTTNQLDSNMGDKIIEKCMQKGLLMVRTGTGTIKIGPPLNIPDDALLEGISIIEESIKELTKEV